jgi:hypothetical protein
MMLVNCCDRGNLGKTSMRQTSKMEKQAESCRVYRLQGGVTFSQVVWLIGC